MLCFSASSPAQTRSATLASDAQIKALLSGHAMPPATASTSGRDRVAPAGPPTTAQASGFDSLISPSMPVMREPQTLPPAPPPPPPPAPPSPPPALPPPAPEVAGSKPIEHERHVPAAPPVAVDAATASGSAKTPDIAGMNVAAPTPAPDTVAMPDMSPHDAWLTTAQPPADVDATGAGRTQDLMDVYLQALRSNPELEQVGARQRASRAAVGVSRSYLLPQLHGSVSFSEQHGIRSSSGLFDTPVGSFRSSVEGHYRQRYRTDSITLDQVLFDLGRYQQLQASESGAAADAASYASAEQLLILRVAKAYFAVLADEAQLANARSNAASLKKQLQQVQMKRDAGFASTTAVSDARAAYNSALATAIRAGDAVHQDRQALARVTGQPSGTLKDLARQLPLTPPRPNDVDAWVDMALTRNPALRSQHKRVASAQHRISAARDSRLPTLNATIGYSHNPSWGNPGVVNAGSLPAGLGRVLHVNNRTTNTTLGLVLDIPLFSGGIIHSQVRQAIAQRDQAKHALESKRRAIVSRTRNAFTAIRSGIDAVNADKRAVAAAKKALALTRKDYGIGTRSIVDLLIAQRNYFSALSTYSRARYALVIDQLNLKFAAGTLSVRDLKAVNALLVTRRRVAGGAEAPMSQIIRDK